MRNCFCCFQKEETPKKPLPVRSPEGYKGGPKIVIIGAGAAGLACGVKLIEHGFDQITILEAENRIGGRIHTVPFGKNCVDLGAQWVHGETNNVVYEMIKNLDMLAKSGDAFLDFQCIRSNGEIVDNADVKLLKDIMSEIFQNREEMSEYNGSLGDFLKTKFFEALDDEKYSHIEKDVCQEFFENFKKIESSESSLTLNDVSARGFVEYWACEGDYLINWKHKGYEQFVRVLTRARPGENMTGMLSKKIVLNAKVKKILSEQADGTVKVICDNIQRVFIADSVVVTVSLGVLKKYARELFSPLLPERKTIAIDGIGFGDVFKIFMEFSTAFWPRDWPGFTTLWRAEDLDELREQNLLWMQDIYGFYTVYDQPHLLEAWAVGPNISFLEEFPLDELQMRLIEIIRRFFPDRQIPDPVKIIKTQWSTNDNFLGGYSFRTLRTESVGTNALELSRPINTTLEVALYGKGHNPVNRAASFRATLKPTILFAGEATSPHYFSTVHGAVESGWREANRLAGYYDGEK